MQNNSLTSRINRFFHQGLVRPSNEAVYKNTGIVIAAMAVMAAMIFAMDTFIVWALSVFG